MPSSIISPFPVFNDLDGSPLENGYIYIGQSNLNPETAPVNVFWDAALTIPAAQPVRTVGGYPSRQGTPSRFYSSTDTYSITVRNKNRALVFSAFDQSDAPTSVFDISTQLITATASQTTFSLTVFSYLPGTDTLQVFRNGLRLNLNLDYLETNSSTVTLTAPAAAGDQFLFQGGAVITGDQTPGTSVSFIQAGAGAVTRNMQDKVRESVSVLDFGADNTGATDAAPAIRLAIASNRNILIPPGTYLLNSTVTAPPSAYDPPCVLFDNISNFSVSAYGATFQIGSAAGRCGAIQFNRCDNFSFVGAKIVGNTTTVEKNSGVATSSVTNFRIADLYIVNMYKDGGTACVGTWAVNGVFENITAKNVYVMFDDGMRYNVTYSNIRAFGCDQNGNSGSGQIGGKGFSIVNDPPNASTNFTGYTFTYSQNVIYENSFITNFATGALLTSGYGISYSNCIFFKNTGSGSAAGIGIFIYYDTGTFSSVGFAPGDISITGCQFIENGSLIAGGGVFIDGSLIANSDYIQNISISGCVFDNNRTQGIAFSVAPNVRNVISVGNVFWGANQTYSISPDLLPLINFIGNDSVSFKTDVALKNQLRLENNRAIFFKNAIGNASLPAFGVGADDSVYIKPVASAAVVDLQNFAGTAVFRTTQDTSNPAYIYVNGALKQVTVGAADSAGTGFRVLRVAN
jgi:hypothetical protein